MQGRGHTPREVMWAAVDSTLRTGPVLALFVTLPVQETSGHPVGRVPLPLGYDNGSDFFQTPWLLEDEAGQSLNDPQWPITMTSSEGEGSGRHFLLSLTHLRQPEAAPRGCSFQSRPRPCGDTTSQWPASLLAVHLLFHLRQASSVSSPASILGPLVSPLGH